MTPPAPDPTRPPLWHESLIACSLILVGVALRLRTYAACRSLRRDEAMLTLNLVRRTAGGLLRPLDDAQGAPIGFLLLEKLSITTMGQNEYALRLVPFLAGVASLPLFWVVARRVLGGRGALVALGLFAAAEPLVFYASETKQYSVDLAIALGLLALANGPRSRPWALALAGSAAVWFSHPALFVLGGIGLAMLLFDRRPAMTLGVAGCWALSFAVEDRLFLRHLRKNEELTRFWSGSFMPFPPTTPADLRWFVTSGLGVFHDPVGLPLAPLCALLYLTGLACLAATNRRALALVLTPVVLTLVASGLTAYPFSTRLILFLAPLVLIPTVAGLGVVGDGSNPFRRATAWVLCLAVALPPAIGAAKNLVRPLRSEELKTVMREVARRRRPLDKNYVYFASEQAFRFYTEYADRPIPVGPPTVVGVWGTRADRSDYARDVASLRGCGRVWVFFSHAVGGDEPFYLSRLDAEGRRLDSVRAFGASAYLYDFGPSASSHSRDDAGG